MASADGHDDLLAGVRAPYPFRTHQQQALDALETARADGRRRAWVVLPPGAGKTLVGLETARRRGRTTVVLGPNTAIQSQWVRGWDAFLPAPDHPARAGTSRDLSTFLSALTYQSLATFAADDEVDEEGQENSLLVQLHPNGRALVEALKAQDHVTLILDECHHLLEVWGQLLAELLEQLPNAFVVGLTATPPGAMTKDQERLVDSLFGDTVFEVSIPAVVREGDLAPFAELAWLTTPTPHEADYLSTQAERFRELVTALTDPAFGSTPFLEWVEKRFVHSTEAEIAWGRLAREQPDLTDAALRLHHQGLLGLPPGARLRENHRHDPTADDWVLLVEDWLRNCVARSGESGDDAVVEAVRRALPSVGYQWTRTGIRRGRSPVDRVLARSEAKTHAVVDIVTHEHLSLGARLRMLVLCDHEFAAAMLPTDLTGVLDQQAGSARLVLDRLACDAVSAQRNPLLITGRTVGGQPATLTALIDYVAAEEPELAATLVVAEPERAVTTIDGAWKSRTWVRWATRFFEAGHCQVLIGTRGLLGEGWDARAITGLIDLTAATTSTAVVQTRGRALRTDPSWPEKVALTWTVVCVSEEHPKGASDWERFCRKHDGFFGVDEEGSVVDGVAHVDPLFSPYAPPATETFAAINARMVARSQRRDEISDLWGVGQGYEDTLVHTVRLLPQRPPRSDRAPVAVAVRPTNLDVRRGAPSPWRPHPLPLAVLAVAAVVLVGAGSAAAAALVAALGGLAQLVVAASRGQERAQLAAQRPSIEQVACAVADALGETGLAPVGAEAVRVEVDADGEYRCALHGVTPEASAVFATALDEVVSPMVSPRYVLPRWVVDEPHGRLHGLLTGLRVATGTLRPSGQVWHSVPTVLGTRGAYAQAFSRAWDHWVGGGPAIYTGSAEGEGVLVTHRGSDPFDVTTVLRVHWR